MTQDTTRLSRGSRPADTTRVATMPALSPSMKRRVDLALACIAGALAILVGITARGAIGPHANDAASPPPTVAPLASTSPAPAEAPAQAAPKKDHGGKGRD